MKKYFDEKLQAWITVCPPGAAAGAEPRKYKDVQAIPCITARPLGRVKISKGTPPSGYLPPSNGKSKAKKKRFWR